MQKYVFAALALLCCCTAHAQRIGPCEILAKPMDHARVPGVAVAAFHDGIPQLFYCGYANRDTMTPVGPDTVFEAASLSKPVFAYAVLSLVREHKFSLEKPLVEYLGGNYKHRQEPFRAATDSSGPTDTPTDKRFAKITARMVLSHTSGLPNWSRNQKLTLVSAPGAEFHYSGEGFVLLQRAVEAATHQDLESIVQQRVFTPLGMTHSTFLPADARNVATGYDSTGMESDASPHVPLASSSLMTTLNDYTKFLQAILQLPADISGLAYMRLAQTVVDEHRHVTWGLGMGLEDVHNRLTIFHGGSNPGFRSFFALQPDTGDGVLYFSNGEGGADLLNVIAEHWLPGHHPLLGLPLLHPKD